MTKVLALYSIKGGVGKTSSAVNLAFIAAKKGYRTLVWDLDPQGASSYYFRIKAKIKGGSKDLIGKKRELDDVIKGTDFDNLDLVPADFSFRHLDLILDAKKKPTQQLKKLIQPLAEDYDFIFLDCPPSISLLSEAVFAASDLLLSPVIPTTLSIRTLSQLEKFLEDKGFGNVTLMPFLSMVDRRKKMHRDMMAHMLETYPHMLTTLIPHASDIERMGAERLPLGGFTRKGTSINAYNTLWDEIVRRTER